MGESSLDEISTCSAGFHLFVHRCLEDAALAEQVRACAGPSAMLVLTQAEGLAVDPRELRRAAREMKAVCFHWNGPDGYASYRRNWFERDFETSR